MLCLTHCSAGHVMRSCRMLRNRTLQIFCSSWNHCAYRKVGVHKHPRECILRFYFVVTGWKKGLFDCGLACTITVTIFILGSEKSRKDRVMALHERALAILENNVGVSDAVLLDPMTEDAFISNLKKRFDHDQIYVSLSML